MEGQARVRKAPHPGGYGHEEDPAIRIADDRTRYLPMLVPMLDEALGTKEGADPVRSRTAANISKRGCLYGDAAYASRYIVKACRERGLTPMIRLKASSTARGKGAGDT